MPPPPCDGVKSGQKQYALNHLLLTFSDIFIIIYFNSNLHDKYQVSGSADWSNVTMRQSSMLAERYRGLCTHCCSVWCVRMCACVQHLCISLAAYWQTSWTQSKGDFPTGQTKRASYLILTRVTRWPVCNVAFNTQFFVFFLEQIFPRCSNVWLLNCGASADWQCWTKRRKYLMNSATKMLIVSVRATSFPFLERRRCLLLWLRKIDKRLCSTCQAFMRFVLAPSSTVNGKLECVSVWDNPLNATTGRQLEVHRKLER